MEISPTGPLPGPKMLRAKAGVGELEDRVMAEMGVGCEVFAPFRSHRGGRRPLRLIVEGAEASAEDGGLRLRFSLPAGAYATSVLRQVMDAPPWFG
jgi:tRNA pseudouridine13 synthase